jgi:hypothetical protein
VMFVALPACRLSRSCDVSLFILYILYDMC